MRDGDSAGRQHWQEQHCAWGSGSKHVNIDLYCVCHQHLLIECPRILITPLVITNAHHTLHCANMCAGNWHLVNASAPGAAQQHFLGGTTVLAWSATVHSLESSYAFKMGMRDSSLSHGCEWAVKL